MAYSDYFDEYDFHGAWSDEWGCEPRSYAPRPRKQLTCRLCGKTGFRWGQVKGGHWALFDGNAPHKQTCTAERF